MRVLKSIGVIGLVCVFAGCGASDAELGAESPVEGQADATSVEGGDEDATEGGTEQVDAVTKPEADAPELAPDDVTPEDAPTPEEDVSVEPDVAPEADASPESDVAPEADAEAEVDAGPEADSVEEEDTDNEDVVLPCDPAACDDANPCTDDLCVDDVCVNKPLEGCCTLDTECDDGSACTADACIANQCVNTPGEGCCAQDGDCEDDDLCTIDTCEAGQCVNKPSPDCCVENEDCADDDACTKEACIEGQCVVKPIPECCLADSDCDDDNACTIDACDLESGLCQPPIAAEGCCVSPADCADDNPCTKSACEDNACGEPYPIEDGASCGDALICVSGECVGVSECGDNIQGFDEACDDGNTKPGDGCSMSCEVESFKPGDIIFTEIMANPSAVTDAMGEWLEIYNTTDEDIDINGWHLSETNANPHVISSMVPVIVPAGGYRVLTLTCDFETNGGVKPVYCYEGAVVDDLVNPGIFLNNDADALSLSWNGVAIDDINYDVIDGWPSGNGASVQLAKSAFDASDNDLAASWCLSTMLYGAGDLGTPGMPNTDCLCIEAALCDDGNACTTDTCADGVCESSLIQGCCLDDDHCDDGNVCTTDTCSSDTLTCEPSVAIEGCCLEGAECDDDNPCTANACVDNACAEPVALEDGLSCGEALICVEGTCVDVPVCGDGVEGFGEACDDANTKPGDGCSMTCTVEYHEPGEIIISEIMSNPSAVIDGQGEWFEVYNTTEQDIDINGWTLTDTTDNVHTISSATPVIVPAMGYFALTLTCDAATNGGITPGYCYEGDVVDDLVNPGVFLNNDTDALSISWNGLVIDGVAYDAELGWALESGASVQLDSGSLDGVANDAAGVWCASTEAYGDGDLGTPGLPNGACGCPEGAPCNDGNACTTDDVCVGGECVGGGTLSCESECSCSTLSCDPEQGCVLAGPVKSHDFEDAFDGLMPGCWTPTAGTWAVASGTSQSGIMALVQSEEVPSALSVALEGHMWSAAEGLTFSWSMRSENTAGEGEAHHGIVFLYQDPENYYAFRRMDNGAGYGHALVRVVDGVESVLTETSMMEGTTAGTWSSYSLSVSTDGATVQISWEADGWAENLSDDSTWTSGRFGLLSNAVAPSSAYVLFDDVTIEGEKSGPTLCEAGTTCDVGCDTSEDCAAGQDCLGKYSLLPGTFGKCTDTSSVPGTDESCDLDAPCGPGLACLGGYAWGDGGWCVPGYFAKTFVSHEMKAIPEAGEIETSVLACGLATVPVDVYVTVDIDHPRPSDLSVTLEDPNGQSGIVTNFSDPLAKVVVNAFPGDDTVKGVWTLRVTDNVEGESGTLHGWSVYLLSNWD